MDRIDWLLGIGTMVAFCVAFQLLAPPYGWVGGLLVSGFMLWRAKRKRDALRKAESETVPVNDPKK